MAAEDRIGELGREAALLRETLGRARESARGALEASDPDRLVTLRLDDDLEVVAVTVARDWARRGGLDALVTALNQAGTQAQLVVSRRWADTVNEARTARPAPPAARSPRRAGTAPGPRVAAPAPAQVADVLGPLRQQLATAQRMRRAGAPRGEQPAGAAEVRGTSQNGRLAVVLVGDDVTRIETNDHWVEQQSPLQLGTVLTEALREALAERRRRRREAPRNEYQQLSAAFARTADAARELGRRRGLR